MEIFDLLLSRASPTTTMDTLNNSSLKKIKNTFFRLKKKVKFLYINMDMVKNIYNFFYHLICFSYRTFRKKIFLLKCIPMFLISLIMYNVSN